MLFPPEIATEPRDGWVTLVMVIPVPVSLAITVRFVTPEEVAFRVSLTAPAEIGVTVFVIRYPVTPKPSVLLVATLNVGTALL